MSETAASDLIRDFCLATGIPLEQSGQSFLLSTAGTNRKAITVVLTVGQRYVSVQSFVARRPDENHEGVYRWLLEQNSGLMVVAFSVDAYGDIYLTGRMPHTSLTADLLDTVMGIVVATSDTAFNAVLELGFRSAIQREWAWRTSRDLDASNLEAFRHLIED